MKKTIYLIILTLLSTGVFAQEITLKGVVTSADDGMPLPGVTVVQEGTTNGTITNIDGVYQLQIPANAHVRFSFIG